MKNTKGLIINYHYCTGCRACEAACTQNGLKKKREGMKVIKNGPTPLSGSRWLFDFMPIMTASCNFCRERRKKGKATLCEHHCPTQCIKYGNIKDYLKKEKGIKKILFYCDEEKD